MPNNFLSIENEKVLTCLIKLKSVAKYMYKTKMDILLKCTLSRNVIFFRYDMYQRKRTEA